MQLTTFTVVYNNITIMSICHATVGDATSQFRFKDEQIWEEEDLGDGNNQVRCRADVSYFTRF